jgi:hypothetical protein
MYQPWIFATTLAAGGGLVAYAVTLHPAGPVDITPPSPAAVHVIPPLPPAAVPEPPAQDRVMELEPVVIQAKLRRTSPVVPPKPDPVDVAAERPCSTWRELGPTHVMAGTPSGDLQVRALCP